MLLFPLVTVFSGADTYQVVKTTFGGHTSTYAEYTQGNNVRIEHLHEYGGRQFPVTINRPDRHVTYALDLNSRQYAEWNSQGPDWILSLAQWISRPPRVHDTGKTVNIYYETIDTGERKEFFGHIAKHFRLRERHLAESGACDHSYELEKDGWYITLAASGGHRAYRLYAGLIGSVSCRDIVVRHGSPLPPGLAVIEDDGSIRREILALSEAPVDKSLFEAPDDFKKVDSLPGFPRSSWSQRLDWEWSQLASAVESWFQ